MERPNCDDLAHCLHSHPRAWRRSSRVRLAVCLKAYPDTRSASSYL